MFWGNQSIWKILNYLQKPEIWTRPTSNRTRQNKSQNKRLNFRKVFRKFSRISSGNLPEDCTLSGLNTLNILLIKGITKFEPDSVLGRDFVCFVRTLLMEPSLTGQVLLLVGNSLLLNSAILDYTLIQILIEGMNHFVYSTKNLQLYRYSFWLLRVMFVITSNDPSNVYAVQNMVQTLNWQ